LQGDSTPMAGDPGLTQLSRKREIWRRRL
jgi:hypothetical protein